MEQTTTRTTNPRAGGRLLKEVLFIGIGYLIYSQVRGLAADRVVDAFANGYEVVELEQQLGIFKELAVQAYVLPHDHLVDIFNFVYFYALFPLLLPTAAFLYLKQPRIYTLSRNAFLISGAIAVCFFLLVPTAPPRLIGMGFIDTLGHSFTPTYDSIPGVNHFAALPSMHVGWNFLMSIALFMALRGRAWRSLVLMLPVLMFMSTVATGNHYFLDGLLGMLVAALALSLALGLERLGEKWRLAAPLTQAPSSS